MTFNINALLVGVGLCVSGCALVHPLTSETTASIVLTKADSPVIKVDTMRLEHRADAWIFSGSVVRHSPVLDQGTTNSHLLVTLFNAQGQAVLELRTDFAPRLIPRGHRMPGYATFQLDLDSLPIETTRLEIRAFEETAGTTGKVASP